MNILNKIKGIGITYATKPLYTAVDEKLFSQKHAFTQLTGVALNSHQQKIWHAIPNQRKQSLVSIMSKMSAQGRLHTFAKQNTDILLHLTATNKRFNRIMHDINASSHMGVILRNNYGEYANLRLPKQIELSNLMQGDNEEEKNRIQNHFDAWQTEPLTSERLLGNYGHINRDENRRLRGVRITDIHSSSTIVKNIFNKIASKLPKLEGDELDAAYNALKNKLVDMQNIDVLTLKIKQEMNIAQHAKLDKDTQEAFNTVFNYRVGRIQKAHAFLNDQHVKNNGVARNGYTLKQIIVGLVQLSEQDEDISFWSDHTLDTETRKDAYLNELIEKMAESQVGYAGNTWNNQTSAAAYKSCFAGAIERIVLSMQTFVDIGVMPSLNMYKATINRAIINVLNDLGDEALKQADPTYANARNKDKTLLQQLQALKTESKKLKHSDLTVNATIWEIIKKNVHKQMLEEFPACAQKPLSHKRLWRRSTKDKILMQALLESIDLPQTFRVAMGLPAATQENTKPKQKGMVMSEQMKKAGFTHEALVERRKKQLEAMRITDQEEAAAAKKDEQEAAKNSTAQ